MVEPVSPADVRIRSPHERTEPLADHVSPPQDALSSALAERDALAAALALKDRELGKLEEQHRTLKIRSEAAVNRLQELAETHRAEIEALRRSSSWRVTRPLRGFAHLLRSRHALLARLRSVRGRTSLLPGPRTAPSLLPVTGRPLLLLATHDCSRTGAPTVVLNLLKRLRELDLVDLVVVAKGGGHLAGPMSALAPTIILDNGHAAGAAGHLEELLASGALPAPAAAICNTIVTADLVAVLRRRKVPTISLVHEMPTSIRRLGPEAMPLLNEHAQAVVFGADFVRKAVTDAFPLGKHRQRTVPTGYPVPRLDTDASRANLRTRLRLPPEAVLIVGCGTVDLRKGPDLFIQVAARVVADPRGRDAHFIWIGDNSDPAFDMWMKHDREQMGVEDSVHFIGAVDDIDPILAGADLFLLTSREDPFPLVLMAALAAGLPALAFAGAGGGAEMLDDAGTVVPYLDAAAMAEGVLNLLADPGSRADAGRRARERFDRHYAFDKFLSGVWKILREDAGARILPDLPDDDGRRRLAGA